MEAGLPAGAALAVRRGQPDAAVVGLALAAGPYLYRELAGTAGGACRCRRGAAPGWPGGPRAGIGAGARQAGAALWRGTGVGPGAVRHGLWCTDTGAAGGQRGLRRAGDGGLRTRHPAQSGGPFGAVGLFAPVVEASRRALGRGPRGDGIWRPWHGA